MKVEVREGEPQRAKTREYWSPTQTSVRPGTEYEVHGASVHDGVVFFLVVDDLDTPVFLPADLFTVTDSRVPPSWITSVFPDGPTLLAIGPAFLAGSLEEYNGMVDQRAPQVRAFWNYVESRRQAVRCTEE